MQYNAFQKNDDDYLSEFRQKVATQKMEDTQERQKTERQKELRRARNGFIGTLTGVALAGIIGWFLLSPRLAEQNPDNIPVIRRPLTPVKTQPNDPGGLEILNQDKSIYDLVEKKDMASVQAESILPQPEAPKMPTIVPEPDVVAEAPSEVSQVSEPETIDELLETADVRTDIAEIKNNATDKIVVAEKIKDIKVEVKTVEKTAVADKAEKAVSSSSVEKKAEPVVAEKVSSSVQSLSRAKNGDWQIQLMASPNKDGVEKGWKTLTQKYAVLKDLPYEIETAKTDAGGYVYRLKAGAFTDKENADKVCDRVKQAGGSCFVRKK